MAQSNLLQFAQSLESLLITNQVSLGLHAVYFGDQNRVADTPTACIEPTTKDNNLRQAGASRKLDPQLSVLVIIYHSSVQSPQQTMRECVQFAETVEALINAQVNFGQTVVHGYVQSLECGYITKGEVMFRSARLLTTAKTSINL